MIEIKKDKYKEARGSYSRFLEVRCDHCLAVVCKYQKDGPGELKRMYLDRIVWPEKLIKLQGKPLKQIPQLDCPDCKRWLAVPYVYQKEKRLAFRIFVGALKTKITNSNLINK